MHPSHILAWGLLLTLTSRAQSSLLIGEPIRTSSLRSPNDSISILFFGDSITEGWMDAEQKADSAFPALVREALHASHVPARVLVRGRGGETTEDAIDRFASEVLYERPEVTVIAFGTNDAYIHGDATRPRVSVDRFADNMDFLLHRLTLQGGKVILLGLTPILESRFSMYSAPALYAPYGGAQALRARYDSVLFSRASPGATFHPGCTYVAGSFASDTLELCLGRDGVHPTPRGHRHLATALTATIRSLWPVHVNVLPESCRLGCSPNPFDPERHRILTIHLPAEWKDRTGILRFHDLSGRQWGPDWRLAVGNTELSLHLERLIGKALPPGPLVVSILSPDAYFMTYLYFYRRSSSP